MSHPPAPGSAADDVGAANLRGILAMLAAMASFNVNDALVKLVSAELPLGEILFIRSSLALLLILLALKFRGQLRPISTLLTWPVSLRTFGELGATLLFLTALFQMPIAEAIAILQVSPLTVTAASALFLGEHVGWRRWSAALVGLVGVLIIIRPGSEAFSVGALLALGSVAFMTLRDVITRKIPAGTPALMISLATAAAVGLMGLGLGMTEDWHQPSATATLQLIAATVFVVGGYVLIVMAMRSGEVAVVAPFRYSIVPYSILLGYFLWDELPDRMTVLGIVIVIAAGAYTFERERRLKRGFAATTGKRF